MKTHSIKLSIAQIKPEPSDLKHNLKQHLRYIKTAKKEGSGLVIFPELSLTGYFLKDSIYDVAINLKDESKNIIHDLLPESNNISVIAGFVEVDDDYNFYNSSLCMSGGRILNVHRKVYLPTYGMFEEMRYFKAGNGFNVFGISGITSAILTCEDAWHLSSSYIAVNKGAKLIIINSASPARGIESGSEKFSSIEMWERLLSVIAFYYKSYVIYANRVGFEDGIGFAGGSCIFSPDGNKEYHLEYLDEGLLSAKLNISLLKNERFKTPLLRDENLSLTVKELESIISTKN